MGVERISGQPSQPPALAPAKGRDGEEAFHDLAKSEEDAGDYKSATDSTQLTRRIDPNRNRKAPHTSLSRVVRNNSSQAGETYVTLIVDGELTTIRYICHA